ncbi:Peroxisomal targeting signal 1 receptor [Dirofilaria immitis]
MSSEQKRQGSELESVKHRRSGDKTAEWLVVADRHHREGWQYLGIEQRPQTATVTRATYDSSEEERAADPPSRHNKLYLSDWPPTHK